MLLKIILNKRLMEQVLSHGRSRKIQCNCQTLVILLFVFTLVTASKTIAGGFEIKGILKIKVIKEDNTIFSDKSESFDLSVDGCKWFIATAPYPDTENGDIIKWEIGSDGNDETYQVSLFNRTKLNSASANDSIGLIENGNVPDNLQENQVAELWLAFASGCYLNGATNGMLKPVYFLSQRMPGHLDHAAFERFDLEPKLPRQVIYTNDMLMVTSKGKPMSIPLPPPFEKGFVRAEYTVVVSTNVNNMTLPTKFLFTENGIFPVEGRSLSSAVRMIKSVRTVEGTVTSVVPKCDRTSFIPSLTEKTFVDDRRFSDKEKPVASLSYMVTNGVWPPATAAILQGLYKHELNVRAHMVSTDVRQVSAPQVDQHPGRKFLVRIVITLAFVAPPLIILINMLRRKVVVKSPNP